MTNKIIAAFVLTLALAGAAWAGYGDRSFKVPQDVNNNLAQDLTFVGARTSSSTVVTNGTNTVVNAFSNSATPVSKQWVKGEGTLYGVEIGSGASTLWVICIDAAAGTATTINDATVVRLIEPCYANTTNSAQCGSAPTGPGFLIPRHFVNGLYCYTDNGAGTSYIPIFRLKSE